MADSKETKVKLALHVSPAVKELVEKLAAIDGRSLSNKGEQILKLGLKSEAIVAETEAAA